MNFLTLNTEVCYDYIALCMNIDNGYSGDSLKITGRTLKDYGFIVKKNPDDTYILRPVIGSGIFKYVISKDDYSHLISSGKTNYNPWSNYDPITNKYLYHD